MGCEGIGFRTLFENMLGCKAGDGRNFKLGVLLRKLENIRSNADLITLEEKRKQRR